MTTSKKSPSEPSPPADRAGGAAWDRFRGWARRPSSWLVLSLGAAVLAMSVLLAAGGGPGGSTAEAAEGRLTLEEIPFDGLQAHGYVKQLCAIGPRPTGSAGMARQQQLLKEHFERAGGQVELQPFTMRHPVDGSPVAGANLIVRWHPQSTERVLLAAHYDTLPYPLLDPVDPRGVFVGANDGASGVGILMELGNQMKKIDCRYGVDFVFLDAEEFIFDESHPFFVGSTHFAQEYVRNRPPYRYRWGVLLDMVGDADLNLYMEENSLRWRDTGPLVREIWSLARRLGVREFIPRVRHRINDDHVALHDVGHISCIDIIDFDYPPWHTRGDTPDKLSPLSMAKVGWVVQEWLKTVK